MLKCAPFPSKARVAGLIPRHSRDKPARFDSATLHGLLSLWDPGVAIGQCKLGDIRLWSERLRTGLWKMSYPLLYRETDLPCSMDLSMLACKDRQKTQMHLYFFLLLYFLLFSPSDVATEVSVWDGVVVSPLERALSLIHI